MAWRPINKVEQKTNFESWNLKMSRKYDSSTWYDKPLTKLINAKKRLDVITKICNSGKIIDLGCGGGATIKSNKT